ncbi:hypothetical protein L596_006213 [Steinernema carpocapsae]|uniref:Chitin-binding type-2 domain-containing protein n=1 Tax=Steinernema carpocapsae TaxID=34508 RepID=A0A4U8V1H7_STECR|nr:hypothetical protein L596_006213 [Steinernema carpocapsae]
MKCSCFAVLLFSVLSSSIAAYFPTCVSRPTGFYATAQCSPYFYFCRQGLLTAYECLPGFAFNERTARCEPREHITGCRIQRLDRVMDPFNVPHDKQPIVTPFARFSAHRFLVNDPFAAGHRGEIPSIAEIPFRRFSRAGGPSFVIDTFTTPLQPRVEFPIADGSTVFDKFDVRAEDLTLTRRQGTKQEDVVGKDFETLVDPFDTSMEPRMEPANADDSAIVDQFDISNKDTKTTRRSDTEKDDPVVKRPAVIDDAPFSCVGKKDGFYPAAKCGAVFYVCKGDVPKKMNCPDPFIFNLKIGLCEPKSEVSSCSSA